MTVYAFIAEIMFFVLVVLTCAGALLAVKARILLHAVLGLGVSFLGVAGLYIHLGSLFLSMMQILIYLGAIGIVLVFGVMVGYSPRQVVESKIRGENLLLALPASAAGLLMLWVAISRTKWNPADDITGSFAIREVGLGLLHEYCLVFELISVLLLIAVVGAVIVVNSQEESDGE